LKKDKVEKENTSINILQKATFQRHDSLSKLQAASMELGERRGSANQNAEAILPKGLNYQSKQKSMMNAKKI
jgi:hypothetical protein